MRSRPMEALLLLRDTRYLHMFILIDYFWLYSNGCSRRFCWRKCSQGKMRSFALFFLWHTTLGTRRRRRRRLAGLVCRRMKKQKFHFSLTIYV